MNDEIEKNRFLDTNNDTDIDLGGCSSMANRSIIDEYLSNGMNGSKAYETIKGQSLTARQNWQSLMRHDGNKAYLKAQQLKLSKKADFKHLQIVKELISFAYADAADFIELSPKQIKELPSNVRRQIQSFKHKKHSYEDRNGQPHEEEIIEVKFIDKLKAMDMLNKHLGFYESDNRQKANNINLNKIDNVTLNALYQAIRSEE